MAIGSRRSGTCIPMVGRFATALAATDTSSAHRMVRCFSTVADREALRLDEAAEVLGVHVETARKWAIAGELPARKVGGIWLVGVTALRQWLHGREAEDAGRRVGVPAEGPSLGDRKSVV